MNWLDVCHIIYWSTSFYGIRFLICVVLRCRWFDFFLWFRWECMLSSYTLLFDDNGDMEIRTWKWLPFEWNDARAHYMCMSIDLTALFLENINYRSLVFFFHRLCNYFPIVGIEMSFIKIEFSTRSFRILQQNRTKYNIYVYNVFWIECQYCHSN